MISGLYLSETNNRGPSGGPLQAKEASFGRPSALRPLRFMGSRILRDYRPNASVGQWWDRRSDDIVQVDMKISR